ncbi:MAG: redox-regulated ATPase YchF [Anaerolineae bacterium]
MEVGIIGLPLAGKTTIFNALTRSRAETTAYGSSKSEIHTAIVDVPDQRVNILSDMFKPRKTIWAKIQFTDIGGLAKGKAQGTGLDQQTLNALSKCDTIVQVVRAFEPGPASLLEGGVHPERDLHTLRLELILSDLGVVERRIERIQAGLGKARAAEVSALKDELALMERFKESLEAEVPIADLELEDDEALLIRGFQFLTAKPALVVLNLGEEDPIPTDLSWIGEHRNVRVVTLRGSIEMEIAQLPEEDVALFLETYQIGEPSLNLLVRECYDLLGLMSFFTVGEDEVRAWTVHRGATAVEAAGAIHSDLARGFIRAEVLSYDDMIACRTMVEARKQGKLRLEGKEYVVRDGDILNIRFNV